MRTQGNVCFKVVKITAKKENLVFEKAHYLTVKESWFGFRSVLMRVITSINDCHQDICKSDQNHHPRLEWLSQFGLNVYVTVSKKGGLE